MAARCASVGAIGASEATTSTERAGRLRRTARALGAPARPARRWWARRSRRQQRSMLVGAGVVAVLLVAVVVMAARTVSQLKAARDELDEAALAVLDQDTERAQTLLDDALADIEAARDTADSGPARLLGAIPGLGSPLKAARDAADAGVLVVDGTRLLIDAAEALPTSGLNGLEGGSLAEVHASALEASDLIGQAAVLFGEARTTMEGPAGSWLPLVSGPSGDLLDTVDDGLVRLDNGQRALELAAHLTAPDSDERVLLLAMNSLEQRPIGGFFGSFGVLSFTDGAVELERFASVEALDLTDPPMEIPGALALALPNKRYGIENAGFFPTFPRVGAEAQELFRRQGGGEVSAVIAVSEDLVQDLLGVFGPITVPGYDEPVTKEGFEGRVLWETELKPVSDNPRKKFLIELSKIVFDRLLTLPADEVPAVGEVFANAVGRGELLVWFDDPDLQALVEGTLAAGEYPQVEGDLFAITESNMVRSKANKDLHRTIDYFLEHDRGRNLRVRVEMVYENRGEYHDLVNPYYNGYVQVYAPVGAELIALPDPEPVAGDDGIAGNGVSDEVIADPGDWDDEGISEFTGYQTFSRSIIVEPGEKRSMVLEYTLPDSVVSGGHYSLTVLRQPGTPNDLITVHLGERTEGVPNRRETRFEADLRGNEVAAWLSERWLVDRLLG